MSRSWLNPEQSDYKGQICVGVIAIVSGFILLFIGLNLNSEILKTVLASGGVGLLIGGGAVIRTALRSRSRAERMKDEK